jgi:hypothetical protein
MSGEMKASNQSMNPTAPYGNKLTHSLPLIRPLAFPSMSRRFPRAPFSVFATTPSTLSRLPAFLVRLKTRSLLTLTRSYPRRFTFYVAWPAAPISQIPNLLDSRQIYTPLIDFSDGPRLHSC